MISIEAILKHTEVCTDRSQRKTIEGRVTNKGVERLEQRDINIDKRKRERDREGQIIREEE